MLNGRVTVAAAVAVALSTIAAAGCGSSEEGTSAAGQPEPKRAKVAAVLYATGDSYFQQARCGAEATAKRLGFDLQWQGPAKFDPPAEVTALAAVTQRKPDVVVLNPADPKAFLAPVRSLVANGTPVVTFDGTLAERVDSQNVRTDGKAAGASAADALAEFVEGKGKVAIQGAVPGLLTLNERVDGFKRRLADEHPNIEVLPTQFSGGDPAKASSATQALLKAHPDLNAIYTVVSLDAPPTLAGIKAAGRTGQMTLVSWDATPGNVRLLKDGSIAAIVAQDPIKTIDTALKTAHGLATGELKETAVKQQVLLPATVITKENLNEPEVARLYGVGC